MSTGASGGKRLNQSKQELARNIIAAASTTAFCVSLLNPLDVLRIKWQTRPPANGSPPGESSLWRFAAKITREGGGIINALYRPGLGVNAASVACSSGLRLGLYPVTKDSLSFLLGHDEALDTRPQIMLASGFLSGALGFFLATPLFTAKIQAQSYQAGAGKAGRDYLTALIRSGHPFKGASILVARGALFSAGFSAGYDGTKSQFRQRGFTESPWIHAGASIVAAFFATAVAAPFDSILTRYQSMRIAPNSSSISPLTCATNMFREGGIRVFFKGWTLFFSRVAPLFLIQLPLYEQTRKLLGMDFMR